MQVETLETAIAEAERFIKAAQKCISESASDTYIWGSKYSGAAKRASMDLTRALADVRRRPE